MGDPQEWQPLWQSGQSSGGTQSHYSGDQQQVAQVAGAGSAAQGGGVGPFGFPSAAEGGPARLEPVSVTMGGGGAQGYGPSPVSDGSGNPPLPSSGSLHIEGEGGTMAAGAITVTPDPSQQRYFPTPPPAGPLRMFVASGLGGGQRAQQQQPALSSGGGSVGGSSQTMSSLYDCTDFACPGRQIVRRAVENLQRGGNRSSSAHLPPPDDAMKLFVKRVAEDGKAQQKPEQFAALYEAASSLLGPNFDGLDSGCCRNPLCPFLPPVLDADDPQLQEVASLKRRMMPCRKEQLFLLPESEAHDWERNTVESGTSRRRQKEEEEDERNKNYKVKYHSGESYRCRKMWWECDAPSPAVRTSAGSLEPVRPDQPKRNAFLYKGVPMAFFWFFPRAGGLSIHAVREAPILTRGVAELPPGGGGADSSVEGTQRAPLSATGARSPSLPNALGPASSLSRVGPAPPRASLPVVVFQSLDPLESSGCSDGFRISEDFLELLWNDAVVSQECRSSCLKRSVVRVTGPSYRASFLFACRLAEAIDATQGRRRARKVDASLCQRNRNRREYADGDGFLRMKTRFRRRNHAIFLDLEFQNRTDPAAVDPLLVVFLVCPDTLTGSCLSAVSVCVDTVWYHDVIEDTPSASASLMLSEEDEPDGLAEWDGENSKTTGWALTGDSPLRDLVCQDIDSYYRLVAALGGETAADVLCLRDENLPCGDCVWIGQFLREAFVDMRTVFSQELEVRQYFLQHHPELEGLDENWARTAGENSAPWRWKQPHNTLRTCREMPFQSDLVDVGARVLESALFYDLKAKGGGPIGGDELVRVFMESLRDPRVRNILSTSRASPDTQQQQQGTSGGASSSGVASRPPLPLGGPEIAPVGVDGLGVGASFGPGPGPGAASSAFPSPAMGGGLGGLGLGLGGDFVSPLFGKSGSSASLGGALGDPGNVGGPGALNGSGVPGRSGSSTSLDLALNSNGGLGGLGGQEPISSPTLAPASAQLESTHEGSLAKRIRR
uniref:Uncharacterized protein n=1 Tax=Chromera velia CCMP2878 TaxID=1169474 RepID=A0A0G4HHC1_9ALVE|eukprot:Cvel_27445.t1-p1 / transcript=Cvel_27445.t1 / gene=Cvel_27445 / organism=Chromera_velia_CCMP2878 / gene_product=hypothetical protein / transcript_product=hypothetical protein / location=Cvel_scaffold3425:6306-14469(+) / protein_length=1004 / sequence_SO=supercontig / SO=protein_coding / is_pseudo=false